MINRKLIDCITFELSLKLDVFLLILKNMDYLLQFCNDYLGFGANNTYDKTEEICNSIDYHKEDNGKGFNIFVGDIHIATEYWSISFGEYHNCIQCEFDSLGAFKVFEPYLIPLFQASIERFKEINM